MLRRNSESVFKTAQTIPNQKTSLKDAGSENGDDAASLSSERTVTSGNKETVC
jgi:hypothetical protein